MIHVVYASSEEEMQKHVEDMAKHKLRLGAVSNTGLPKGKVRMTFLPESVFTDYNPEDRKQDVKPCNHAGWSFKKHGRRCDCGVFMVDFGD